MAPTTQTLEPPELWGWAPIAAPCHDQRWAQIESASLGVADWPTKPMDVHEVDAYVRSTIAYVPDSMDHWQTPDTTMRRQAGDCEDFAILSRALLLRYIASNRIWFLIARDLIQRSDHAMLIVHSPDHKIYALDNQSPVMPVEQVRDYAPRVAYQGARCWVYGRKRG